MPDVAGALLAPGSTSFLGPKNGKKQLCNLKGISRQDPPFFERLKILSTVTRAGKMAHWVKHLRPTLTAWVWSWGFTWWKQKTGSHGLSSDPHVFPGGNEAHCLSLLKYSHGLKPPKPFNNYGNESRITYKPPSKLFVSVISSKPHKSNNECIKVSRM